jgi:epoxyqueuosine reductase QueG
MDHPVLSAIRRAGFTALGWFEPRADDQVPAAARFVVLVGNAGPDMFRRFAAERDPATATIDAWTRDVIGRLAADLSATAVYPFDTPPLPFLTWARRGGAGHVSPLGLNIHGTYGLWHAYRAALLFPVAFDLPTPSPGARPCDTCVGTPCLSTCPVGAFSPAGYDVAACAAFLETPEGEECLARGCRARRACPVGQGFTYSAAQASFFMRAFIAARRKAG